MTTRDKQVRRPLRERLKDREPRPLDRMKEPIVGDEHLSVQLNRSEEIAAAAVGLMMLDIVEKHGRTRLFERAIDNALDRFIDDLDPDEIVRLEVEAYEVLDWLAGESDPITSDPSIAKRSGDTVYYNTDATAELLLREALFQEFDVHIHYFTRTRSELNKRIISPYAISADKYVRAWCHSRRAQRIFRIDRISHCIPVGGRPFEPKRSEDHKDDNQLSLLDED